MLEVVAWIVIGLVLAVLAYGVLAYNRLVALRNRVENGWSQIDVQLRRRHDLIPNLVETVQGYAAHEREVFERVTEARIRGMAAGPTGMRAEAENAITSALGRLIAVAENYPALKASESFLLLQEELVGTESKIAYARQFYNDQVTLLNTRIESFPSNIVARIGDFKPAEFFDIEEPVRGPVRINL